MDTIIRAPKDFWSGAIFIIVGLVAIIVGEDYSFGSAGKMGPGYFPTVLGALLAIIGAISFLRSLIKSGEKVGRFAIRETALVLLSIVLFGILMRGAGLSLAVIVMVMASGFASTKYKLLPYLAVAIGLALFSCLVFVKALGLPMPILGSWLGF